MLSFFSQVGSAPFFDTVSITVPSADKAIATALKHQVGLCAVQ